MPSADRREIMVTLNLDPLEETGRLICMMPTGLFSELKAYPPVNPEVSESAAEALEAEQGR